MNDNLFRAFSVGNSQYVYNHRRPKLTIREIDRINDLCRRANDLCKRMSDLRKRIEWDVTTSSARCCVTI